MVNLIKGSLFLVFILECFALPINNTQTDHSTQPNTMFFGDTIVFDDDMFLTDEQKQLLYGDPKHQIQPHTQGHVNRKMVAQEGWKWPKGVIPYTIHPNVNNVLVGRIKAAIAEWNTKTCIRFVNATGFPSLEKRLGHSSQVVFYYQHKSCWTFVGRIHEGKQYANVSEICGVGNIIHELGHVIGFVHEHNRFDRDKYINIMQNNIIPKYSQQFNKYGSDYLKTYGIPYDVGSIMHYSSKAFTKDRRRNTIETDDKKIQGWMGQREHLSFLDAKLANYAYGCHDHCDRKRVCKNGGYTGPFCSCVCPSGLTGYRCEDVVVSNSVVGGCGGLLTDLHGFIQSPRYPKPYLFNEDCYWLIKGSKNSEIVLIFDEFQTEGDDSSCQDYLEVRVYGADHVGQRYCGNQDNFVLAHNSSTLLLHFKSDISNLNYRPNRFRIEYDIIQA